MSLRTRLLVALAALAAVGLLAADVATYRELRSFLLDRVDSTLDQDHIAAEQILPQGGCNAPQFGQLYVRVEAADQSRVLCSRQLRAFGGGPAPAPPSVPADIALPRQSVGPEPTRYLTVDATHGGGQYRLRASIEQVGGSAVFLIVGESLRDVAGTIHRLLLIEVLVTLAVLAAIVGLGLWVVRLGLRPLRAIEQTAAAIAAGDLSQRVERAEPRTEIGRLGLALNAMLGQIENAFNARAESEARLRRFIADASHELRTPLSAVRAYAELFRRGASQRPNDLQRSMRGIEREAERMGVLVDDLLLLARLDEGRPLEQEPVRLDEVAREAVETARALAPERPLTFDGQPAVVTGDHDRLRQVVDNLLANVRAHTPPGTEASVSVHSLDGRAVLEVADRGPGLPAEDSARLFERFFRADPSRTRASGGAGLGLAIVAAVTHAHGGTVGAVSAPGEGSTFRVELPLRGAP
jgi:two-component system, OmpR family, sensor kinase